MDLPLPVISEKDRARLTSAATAALRSDRPAPAASMLLSEISRAVIIAGDSPPKGVVAVNSDVMMFDNVNNAVKRLHLVYPDEMTDELTEVSVLTPLGAALIGLSEGDSISWCNATGDLRSLTVLRVL